MMRDRIATSFLLLLVCGFPAIADLPPGTGHSADGVRDSNYNIWVDSTGESTSGQRAFVVTSPANGWATLSSGAKWIGPAADQTNATRPGTCCRGTTTYRLYFNLQDASTGSLVMHLLGDDSVDVQLNGQYVYINESGSGMYGTALDYPLDHSDGFRSGTNTMDFIVNNSGGGPTGLAVSFSGSIGAAIVTPLGGSTAPSTGHIDTMPDPVDSGSGQFYETESDIELGGPMDLAFRRYYSSQLSNGKVAAALGTNWMSNFDALAVVSGTNAQVLLFGGIIVSFANSAGAWQLVAPKDTVYQFSQNGGNYQFMDPRSRWIYKFSSTGALAAISDRNGNTVTVTQGTNGPTQVSDGLGRTLAFTYTNGQLAQVADQGARKVSLTYTGGLLASVIDIYKQTTKYSYTSAGSNAGLMTQKQLPLGNVPTTQTYDSQGRVLTQTDANNHVTRIAYDGTGGTTITDALGNVTKHVNDGTGDLTRLADPTGAVAFLTYDGSDRRTSFTDKLGNRTTYTYDQASGKLASIADALGNTTSYTYASQTQGGFTFYNLSSIAYPDGTSSSFIYDSNGNLLSLTAQDGTTTTYAYDSNGRITSLTGPNGKVSANTWKADSTMDTATDPLGNLTSFTYDSLKRLTGVTDPNGGKTGYVHDRSTTGPMLATILPGGGSTTIYDDQNRQIQDEGNATGGVFHSDYTGTGKISAVTDPLKNKTTYSYDADDRLSSVTSPASEAVSYAYDAANRVVSVSDANGPRISYTYTSEGNIATSTDGGGRKSSYTYDALGRLATATTPGGNKYATAYDKLGRVSNRTNPLGEVEVLARDPKGRLALVTMPGAITTALKRDAAGGVTSLTSPNGNAWTIGYDALERPSKIIDPLGQATRLTYTGTLLTGATLPLGTLAITSDLNGRITKRQYSDGTAANMAYDGNGLISSADGFTVKRDVKGQPTNINGIGITLDPASRPAVLTYTSGKTITYTYDKGGRLASVGDWVGGKTTLAYDGASRLASLTYPNGVANTFTYDADGRVTKIAVGSIASITLARDAAGKIVSADRNLPRVPAMQNGGQQFTYDVAGQLTSAANDAMGRVTAQNGRKYTWNLASQLTAFADGVNSATFSYDGLGELSSSTFSGAAQTFVYNYLLRYPALSIVRKGANDLRYYVYLPDGSLLYSIEAADNTRRFYHFDEMGNTALLTDDAGGLADSYAITPYGEIADHMGATENPFTWQGKYGVIQEGQGLYHVRARHYDASAARFISRDPEMSADPRSSEPYAYAAGNPLRFIDPFGTSYMDIPSRLSPLSPEEAKISAAAVASSIGAYVIENYDWLGPDLLSFFTKIEIAIDRDPGLDWQGWAVKYVTTVIGFDKLIKKLGGFEDLLAKAVGLSSCSKPPCSGAPASPSGGPPVSLAPAPSPSAGPPVPPAPAPGLIGGEPPALSPADIHYCEFEQKTTIWYSKCGVR